MDRIGCFGSCVKRFVENNLFSETRARCRCRPNIKGIGFPDTAKEPQMLLSQANFKVEAFKANEEVKYYPFETITQAETFQSHLINQGYITKVSKF